MEIKKFKIVSPRDVQSVDNTFEIMLINLNHVVSVKPIKMVVDDKVIDGYWIRISNGKKYRAIEIPVELMDLLNDENKSYTSTAVENVDRSESQLLN